MDSCLAYFCLPLVFVVTCKFIEFIKKMLYTNMLNILQALVISGIVEMA